MKEQNFQNHARVHPPYHFVGSILGLITVIGSVVQLVGAIRSGEGIVTALITVAAAVCLFLTFAFVRLYAMKVQDRVIRTEENFRYYLLTGTALPASLTIGQIIALRFASDEELPALCERAIKENMKPVDIKKAIQNWRADFLRV